MVDRDKVFFKVTVVPAQANNLTHTTASTQEYSKQVEETSILRRATNEVNEHLLLNFGQSVTLILSPAVLLFQLGIYLIGGICSDVTVTYSQCEDRMKDGIDSMNGIGLKSFLIEQGEIELLDITVLDRADTSTSQLVLDVVIVHLDIARAGSRLQLFLHCHVLPKEVVQSFLTGYKTFNTVIGITSQLLFQIA